jgi:4-alpha-glucanotransferase
MRIDFYLRFHTKYGEKIAVKGNVPALGSGNEQQAFPLQFLNSDFWFGSIEVNPAEEEYLEYQYIFTNQYGENIHDGEVTRTVAIGKKQTDHLVLTDTWNYAGEIENAFFTAPFRNVYDGHKSPPRQKKIKEYTHSFRVKAPLLKANEAVCILGNTEGLSDWNPDEPFLLEPAGDWWAGKIKMSDAEFPVTYKYGIYNFKKKEFVRYESGDNRVLPEPPAPEAITILHDGFVRLPNNQWKGAGIAIPVFALRSEKSFGIGEFTDLKLLADWASETGLKLIQLLPVNDTSATFTERDSYPYAAISAFALHPVYINLYKVAGKKHADVLKSIGKKQKQLNNLPQLDYATVIRFKMQLLREIFDAHGNSFLHDEEFKSFFKDNQNWLKAYAAFCYFRDKYNTPDFSKWKTGSVYDEAEMDKLATSRSKAAKEISFHYFVQYHLHLQLKEAVDYAHKKNIALKGDIPIGIYRYGVDAWKDPELYHMCWQAGAPPDDFAVKGQNWGFPTYDWQRMQEDDFQWWRQRFHQMSNYFDAFRIDHILGFFRIWSIPMHAVEGILGRFIPAVPLTAHELGENGIWFNKERFCKPYITDEVLSEIFGTHAEFVKSNFLSVPAAPGNYQLKNEFNTQQKIETYFSTQDESDDNKTIRLGLFDLVSNVIFLEDEKPDAYHFRISVENTTSFRHLDESMKHKLKALYVDYFYHRQDDYWKKEALSKLPALKKATNMLICGEDLGMVPHCVPEVMKDLGILSLEIQRMPKNPQTEFFHPQSAPYLSVITPSTHDMSTVRGWWEENREKTQRFYNSILEMTGQAPDLCDPWVNRAIVLQPLYSPAMWSVFQLQDLLGMSENLRREDPHGERINQPADPKHVWNYRMHLTLEQLLKEKDFNAELEDYIEKSARD